MPHNAGSEQEPRCDSVEAYASTLAEHGIRAIEGAPGTFWIPYEGYALMRIPEICLTPPTQEELDRALWQGRALVASYLCRPDEAHRPNAWLYLSQDKSYSVEKLSVAGRRDARRALRNLRLGCLTWPLVFSHGFTAYSHTRRRIGLSDHTQEHFQKRFQHFAAHPAHCAIGAWKEDRLIAFMTLIVVDDWVAIEGSFSDDTCRTFCPNDGLATFALRRFLVERHFTTLSYGLSSIQDVDHCGGLHAYKQKVGFVAQPVHRAFVLHPLARPFAGQWVLRGVKAMKGLFPRNRLVKKAGGVVDQLLGDNAIIHPAEGKYGDRTSPA